jgi:hypothetical protein
VARSESRMTRRPRGKRLLIGSTLK